jgi:large subunit ribosomal protein L13
MVDWVMIKCVPMGSLAPNPSDWAMFRADLTEDAMQEFGEESPVNTYMAKAGDIERQWYVIDAADQVLGRLASQVALMLRGKHKPTFTPHIDSGDYIIVVNADKIRLTGKKLDQKLYRHHTGYPGGLKEKTYRVLMAQKPEFALKEAVRGMLPKGPNGYAMLKKLHVYRGPEHLHQAQKPIAYTVKQGRKTQHV